MAGSRMFFHLPVFIVFVYLTKCSLTADTLRVEEILQKSDIDNVAHDNTNSAHTSYETDIRSKPVDLAGMRNYGIAGGMVSIDCLRCLCLKQSNCLPVGCVTITGRVGCGYFRFSHDFWIDCGKLGKDWRSCSNDLTCSSQCVQNYMQRYAEKSNCYLNCEGYSRELYGGPNGCNNPSTVSFWEAVQKMPGCKGVKYVYVINCSSRQDIYRATEVIQESNSIDNVAGNITSTVPASHETDIRSKLHDVVGMRNCGIAGGMVSIDCLRCLCLQLSNCLPIGCVMYKGSMGCGYFFLSYDFWLDCGKLGKDFRSCSNDLTCSSQCVQNYMKRYAEKFSCSLTCEGYSREVKGGPNGCNNPRTVAFWEAVQKVPGCKGVE